MGMAVLYPRSSQSTDGEGERKSGPQSNPRIPNVRTQYSVRIYRTFIELPGPGRFLGLLLAESGRRPAYGEL